MSCPLPAAPSQAQSAPRSCFPSHLSLSKPPSPKHKPASGKTWLAGKRLSLSWLVPVTITWCQGSLSAQAAGLQLSLPSLAWPGGSQLHPPLTAVPDTQKQLQASLVEDTSTWAAWAGPSPPAGHQTQENIPVLDAQGQPCIPLFTPKLWSGFSSDEFKSFPPVLTGNPQKL